MVSQNIPKSDGAKGGAETGVQGLISFLYSNVSLGPLPSASSSHTAETRNEAKVALTGLS